MALTTEDKQRISRILSTALSYFTEIAVYADSWHNDFKVERLNEIYAELRLALRGLHLDLHDMTKEDLMLLGCQPIKSGLMLLPMYLYEGLPNGTELVTLSGKKCVVGVDKLNSDTRGGLLAYGVYPKEVEE